jgi:hypothetical protein
MTAAEIANGIQHRIDQMPRVHGFILLPRDWCEVAVAALRRVPTEHKPLDHYFTPDPTKRFCVICGDNDLGSVWGIHRFQVQPSAAESERQ